jgi:hypothetical protein
VFEFTGKLQGQQGHKSQPSVFSITFEDLTDMTITRFRAVWSKFAGVSEESTLLKLQQESSTFLRNGGTFITGYMASYCRRVIFVRHCGQIKSVFSHRVLTSRSPFF